jgi:hypothetical protein
MFDEANYNKIDIKKIDHHLVLKKFNHNIFEDKPKMNIGFLTHL